MILWKMKITGFMSLHCETSIVVWKTGFVYVEKTWF